MVAPITRMRRLPVHDHGLIGLTAVITSQRVSWSSSSNLSGIAAGHWLWFPSFWSLRRSPAHRSGDSLV